MKLLIRKARIIDPKNRLDKTGDLLIEEGKIVRIGGGLSADGAEVIDAGDRVVIPGLIDLHAHLRQPGREDEETIASGTRAAARGGFTAVAAMANTQPVTDSEGAVEFLLGLARLDGAARVYPVGAVTKGLAGKELAAMTEMKKAGAKAFSDDGNPVANSNVMRRALEYARMLGLPVISHSEDLTLSANGVMNEGLTSTVLGLRGVPAAAEIIMVARDLELARLTGGRLHLAHVSCAESVKLIQQAKKEGVAVTAETCPHYFALTEEAVKTFDTSTKVKPPLRSPADVEAIKEGLADGTIDAIATDHAPHAEQEKQAEFDLAPFGLIGLETAFSLGMKELVQKKILSLAQLVEKMSVNPARVLGVAGGELSPGSPADLTIVDPEKEWVVKKEEFLSRSKNSPFSGWTLPGEVQLTICAGKITYRK